ncbi:hypothetical protein EU534_01235 [Candidatus Heimdallarchaeota archaeon]|nr:MAG: hypothetical protein EU534_01235 [Candidatus Heimdallarchaeota archaeon]
MNRLGVGIKVILVLTSLIFLNLADSSTSSSTVKQDSVPISPFPEMVFNYNSTSHAQQLTIILQVNISDSNTLNLVFATSGYKSNSEGIRIIFTFGEIHVNFDIECYLQDHSEHNLTQFFSYPESFSGEMNVTVTFEAQTQFWFETGSLKILSYSHIEQIEPVTITEEDTPFPIEPKRIRFEIQSQFNTVRTCKVILDNPQNFSNLNLTLSFQTNDFIAAKRWFEKRINNQLKISRQFGMSQFITENCILSAELGVNIFTIDFFIQGHIREVEIYNINLSGKGFNFVDDLPFNVIRWFEWEQEEFNHDFDISFLKTSSHYTEQILEFWLDYGFLTSETISLDYEIRSGEALLDTGAIISSKKTGYFQTVYLKKVQMILFLKI